MKKFTGHGPPVVGVMIAVAITILVVLAKPAAADEQKYVPQPTASDSIEVKTTANTMSSVVQANVVESQVVSDNANVAETAVTMSGTQRMGAARTVNEDTLKTDFKNGERSTYGTNTKADR